MSRCAWVIMTAISALLAWVGAACSSRAAEALKPSDKVVTVSRAPLKVKRETVGWVDEGTQLVVLRVQGLWLKVRRDGQELRGCGDGFTRDS